MYKRCGGLEIDETGENSGMSDHNIVKMEWNIGQESTHRWRKKEKKEIRTWYKRDPDSLKKCEEEMEKNIENVKSR